jgi:uncharacterized protein
VSGPVRPAINRDSAFFWEGTQVGELRIQRCGACGLLRHPPGPSCPVCGAFEREYVVAAGTATVFSFTVHHAPPLPGKVLPLTIAVVDLDEGVRMVAELTGSAEELADLAIGDRVAVEWNRIDDDLTLPIWRRTA